MTDDDRLRSTAQGWWLYRDLSAGERPDRVELEHGESARARHAWHANELVRETMDSGGDEAIRMIFALLDAAPADEGQVTVGTGPLEDLVNQHGDSLADALDQAARQSPKFAQALNCVAVEQPLRSDSAVLLARWLPAP